MREIVTSDYFIVTLNLVVFTFAQWMIVRLRIKHVNALIISIPLIAAAISLLDIDLETYREGSRVLSFLLGPSVVALGYMIHKNVKQIERNILPLIICVTLGAVVNSLALNLVFRLFDVDPMIITSLHPKSVTTPIALELSSKLGGVGALTIFSVVFAGMFGSIFGVPLLNILRVDKPIARGAALGAASHAIGTTKAVELGSYEGAVSGLVIGLMGAITAILLPYIYQLGL